jgi:hypothetical protein
MPALQASAVTVVLVHGGFVDGSGWEGVYGLLKKDGYDVSIVQNPTLNLAGDVAATRQIIAQAKSPVVLSALQRRCRHRSRHDPKVAGRVYIARLRRIASPFIPDLEPPPGARPCRSCRRTAICSSTRRNSASFAADVSEAKAASGRLRCRGALMPCRRGDRACVEDEAAGTWSRPRTR